MIAVPTISSPCTAPLTKTQGPGREPCMTRSASAASSPVTCWLTGMATVAQVPGMIVWS